MEHILRILQFPLTLLLAVCAGYLTEGAVATLLPRVEKRWKRFAAIFLFGITVQMPSWIGDENTIILLPFFLLAFGLCYRGELQARIVTGLTFYTLLMPLNMMLDTAGKWGAFLDRDGLEGILIKFLFCTVVWLLLRRLMNGQKTLNLRHGMWTVCGLLILSPLIASLSFSIWSTFTRIDVDDEQIRLAYTILPFAILSAAALLTAMAVFSRQQELEQTAQLADMRELYYDNLQKQQTQLKTLRHDLRNHLTALQGLLAAGETTQAQSYLEDLTKSPALHGVRRICENETANVVLSGKLETIEEKGLTADFLASVPADLGISPIDLCALLGNALDNAIEATEKAAAKKAAACITNCDECNMAVSPILLRLRADRGMVMLRVENTFGDIPLQNGKGLFLTTKTQKDNHGFGIAGMREIVERYGGTLETTIKDHQFELVACLMLFPVQSPSCG